jgi:hypothetical protein
MEGKVWQEMLFLINAELRDMYNKLLIDEGTVTERITAGI